MEKYPQILEDFRKKHPNMNTENLYLCESIDMNGNVIDTKIGVNLLTNYLRALHLQDIHILLTEHIFQQDMIQKPNCFHQT